MKVGLDWYVEAGRVGSLDDSASACEAMTARGGPPVIADDGEPSALPRTGRLDEVDDGVVNGRRTGCRRSALLDSEAGDIYHLGQAFEE